MKEVYVSFEVAKILKEKGFDWECHHFYYCKNNGKIVEKWMPFVADRNSDRWLNEYAEYITAPTQQMACSWLREEHKIHITAEPLEMFKEERIVYEPTIYLLNDFDDFALEYETVHLKECDTNEDAVEAALEYCLTKLI